MPRRGNRASIVAGAAVAAAVALVAVPSAANADYANGWPIAGGTDAVFWGSGAVCGQNGNRVSDPSSERGYLVGSREGETAALPATLAYTLGQDQPQPRFVSTGGNGASGGLAGLTFDSAHTSDQRDREWLKAGTLSPIQPELLSAAAAGYQYTETGTTTLLSPEQAYTAYVALTDERLQTTATTGMTFASLIGGTGSSSIIAAGSGPFFVNFNTYFTATPSIPWDDAGRSIADEVLAGVGVTLGDGTFVPPADGTQTTATFEIAYGQYNNGYEYDLGDSIRNEIFAAPSIETAAVTVAQGAATAESVSATVTDDYVGPDSDGYCTPAQVTATTRLTVELNGTSYAAGSTELATAINALEPGNYSLIYSYDGPDVDLASAGLASAQVENQLVVTAASSSPSPSDSATPTTPAGTETPTPTSSSSSTPASSASMSAAASATLATTGGDASAVAGALVLGGIAVIAGTALAFRRRATRR